MTKGTILYVGGFELPDKNAAAHRVLANAKCLRDIGYNVILVGISKDEVISKSMFDIQGFKCYNVKYPKSYREWLAYITSIKLYKQIVETENPNIIIAYNFPAITLYRLMHLKNIKVYADVTEWYESKGNFVFKFVKSLDVSLRMKYLHLKLDGLIVISDYLSKYYSDKGVENIINIPPLVDLSEEKWDLNPSDKENNREVFKFIYSGSPGKGGKDRLDIVVESLKSFYIMDNIPIVLNVVGITKDYYIKNFNKGKDLDENYRFINFKGRVPHLNSLKLLKQSHWSIFFRENTLMNNAGFPTKFVESVSAGTPVITNASSNIKKYFNFENIYIGFLIDDLNSSYINSVFNKIFNSYERYFLKNKEMDDRVKIFDYRNYKNQFLNLLTKSEKS